MLFLYVSPECETRVFTVHAVAKTKNSKFSKISYFVRRIFKSEVESRTPGSRPRTQKNPRPRPRQPLREQTLPRPRTGMLETNTKGKRHRRKCSQKKKVFKIFFRQSSTEENQKRSSQIFRKVSGVFQQNVNGSKIMLSLRREQGNFRGFEASRPRPKT